MAVAARVAGRQVSHTAGEKSTRMIPVTWKYLIWIAHRTRDYLEPHSDPKRPEKWKLGSGSAPKRQEPTTMRRDTFTFCIHPNSVLLPFQTQISTKIVVQHLSVILSILQCCGSGMFIPDPNLKIPDPESASKNLCIFNPKKLFLSFGKIILDFSFRIPDLEFFPIPDPGVKKAPDSGFPALLFFGVSLKN
jgi:hypothetical protein